MLKKQQFFLLLWQIPSRRFLTFHSELRDHYLPSCLLQNTGSQEATELSAASKLNGTGFHGSQHSQLGMPLRTGFGAFQLTVSQGNLNNRAANTEI